MRRETQVGNTLGYGLDDKVLHGSMAVAELSMGVEVIAVCLFDDLLEVKH